MHACVSEDSYAYIEGYTHIHTKGHVYMYAYMYIYTVWYKKGTSFYEEFSDYVTFVWNFNLEKFSLRRINLFIYQEKNFVCVYVFDSEWDQSFFKKKKWKVSGYLFLFHFFPLYHTVHKN